MIKENTDFFDTELLAKELHFENNRTMQIFSEIENDKEEIRKDSVWGVIYCNSVEKTNFRGKILWKFHRSKMAKEDFSKKSFQMDKAILFYKKDDKFYFTGNCLGSSNSFKIVW